ncbi:membrane-anchored junction protein [Phyllostomus discolor]|uniref:Membrane-anchored junction protein n=1 Tax=Phyllostomus discolor TaxID=89673 RepID=A0A6J2LWI1_9CHIR|nr:membrane-anchored junction protein [Phyllostomus discolor]
MSLKPFTYPFPETRFLHSGSNVYKFKIRYGNRVRREDAENKEVIVQELEDSIRVVLGNLDNLQPFTTKHFIVFPYKSRWERVSHLKFKHGENALVPYPFVLTLYVEMKWFHENLSPGKPMNDSALGLVLTEREAAGAVRKKRKRTEVPSTPSRPGPDRARMRTASQGPGRKKLPTETSRTRERRTPQECQEASALGVTDVQEQGRCREIHSLPFNHCPGPRGFLGSRAAQSSERPRARWVMCPVPVEVPAGHPPAWGLPSSGVVEATPRLAPKPSERRRCMCFLCF